MAIHVAYRDAIHRRGFGNLLSNMTPARGPSKKLAPAISLERCCPHEWCEDEGLQLEIDCSACSGGNSMSNPKCLSGILKALTAGGLPDTIVLKSYIHKRYRGDSVANAAAIASELAALNRALASASLDRPAEKRCRTCGASPENLLIALRRSILEEPTAYTSNRSLLISRIRENLVVAECQRVEDCLDLGVGVIFQGRGAGR